MGRDKRNERKSPPFVMLQHQTMDCPAWEALSAHAKALYPVLLRRAGYNGNRNGNFYLSVREAAQYLNISKNSAGKVLHELQARGFLVARQIGTIGAKGQGRATVWRVTEKGTPDNPTPSKEYMTWCPGADFPVAKGNPPARRKTEARPFSDTGRTNRGDVVELACISGGTGRTNRGDV